MAKKIVTTTNEQDFRARCKSYLAEHWQSVLQQHESTTTAPSDPLEDRQDLIDLIRDCLTSRSKSYHYVLPTNLLAKCVDPALDAHSIQVSFGGSGAFDARSLAHGVIVPFDQANFCVLGGSSEPYANNPLRIPGVMASYAAAQKQHGDWARLIQVLDEVEAVADPAFTASVFEQVLFETYKLLAGVKVSYPAPNRISLDGIHRLVQKYLEEKSGGDRMEALVAALFQTIGERFKLFDEVRREKVNVADQSSGMTADIECRANGEIVLLVEVKDRSLTLVQLSAKLDRARAEQISEILFIAQQGLDPAESELINTRIVQEFISGQNIYVANFADFALGIFILLGEDGRVIFVRRVGTELDRANSAIQHRRAWADLLRTV